MALQQLRGAAKTWVATVIIGALILAFALWGVNDIFQGTVDTAVAQVGDTSITTAAFDREMRSRLRAVSQQTKTEMTMEQARALGMDRAVLDNMIARAALDQQTARLGLTASNADVSAEIRSTSGLSGPDGSFDAGAFQRMLQDNGLTEAFYVESTRQDMARAQMLGSVADSLASPSGLTQLFYAFTTETRAAEYLELTAEDSGAVPEPTDAQLAEYHKAHAIAFSAPEYRAVDYIEIGTSDAAKDVTVSDADLRAEYDSNKASYEKPETRDVEQIPFASKEEAEAGYQKIKSGTSFLALAQEKGLKETDVKLGTFPQSGLDPKLAGPVFAAAEGAVTEPVQGPFGWVILRAAKVTPGESKSFDALKETLRAGLVKSRATGRMAEIANAFEDKRGGGSGLADAAKAETLSVHHVDAIDRSGLMPDGKKAEIPAAAAFLEQVFATESGDESDMFQSDDGTYYAVKVTGVTPGALKPLADVREQVRAGWMKDAKAKTLETRVQSLAAQAGKAGNLGQASTALGRKPSTVDGLLRNKPADAFGAPLLAQIFSVPQGGVVFGPSAKEGNYIIARVTGIAHKTPDMASAEYAQFRQSMGQQLGEDLAEGLVNAVKKRVSVSIHEKTLQNVFGEPQ